MSTEEELWFKKWKLFYLKLDKAEQHQLKAYFQKQLTKDCPSWDKMIQTLDTVQRAAKGDLHKKK